MFAIGRFGMSLPLLLALLAHLAGLVVAIILLTRKKGTPALLALIAFGLLFLLDIGGLLRITVLDAQLNRALGARMLPWAFGGLGCCCGLLDLAAIVCLIIALWQGLSGMGATEATEEEEAPAQEE